MNMKSIVLLTLVLTISAFAHRTLLMVDDNGDGTIYIEAGLSTGGSAAGAKVILTDRATGRPLWQGEIPEEGSITTDRPAQPYSVTLSMGEGHTITQKGPAFVTAPTESKSTESKSTESTPTKEADATSAATVSSADETAKCSAEATSDEAATEEEPHTHSHGDETHTH